MSVFAYPGASLRSFPARDPWQLILKNEELFRVMNEHLVTFQILYRRPLAKRLDTLEGKTVTQIWGQL
jgi:hypothetical protein